MNRTNALAAPSASLPIARETAETLAQRCALGLLAYPVSAAAAILMAPGESRRLWVEVACVLAQVLVAGLRLLAMLPFDRRYASNPARWRRNFHLGAYGSGLVWVVFALHEMNASGSAWPTWMILAMTAGIASGANTSLSPDPPLLYRIMPLLLAPLALWGLTQQGACGNAIVLVVTVYLAFILAQARHNCRAFRQSTADKQALREAGLRREALVDSIDGIVWEADPWSRQFTFLGGRAVNILGYPVDRWLAEPSFWKDHLHPGDRERAFRLAVSAAADGRDYTSEYRMLAADGRAVWFRDIVTVSKEGGAVVALRGVMLDVTAHKHASEQRDMLADALRTVREAVTIAGPEGRILFVNDAFLDLYGYGPDEILSASILTVRSPRNPPELDAAIAEATARGGWRGEVWNRRKDGSEFPISLSTALVRDQSGHTIAQVGVATDITGRKRAEDEWKHATETAEQSNRAKSAFLANMSHEIRTPMNGILGMIGLLLDGGLDPRQRRRAETVRDSAEALLNILNDVLDLSKMEAGKLQLENVPFDLRKLVEGVADIMAVKAQEKGVEMLCSIDHDVPTQLRGDASRLRQILVNLGGNAVKFTRAGEVSIRVKMGRPSNPTTIRFEVTDTGIGIPADKGHLLFQPFYQADTSTARHHGGTGLGLSIVRLLVEIMGGEVGFHSEEGRGSCFWSTIPLEPQSTERPRALSLAGRNVLVVDRNTASRRLILELLSFWKSGAAWAASAQEAFDLAEVTVGRPFDAVLVDLNTLGSQCEQFLARIRECRRTGRAAVVLLTALSQAEDGERWCGLGFAGPVGKPVKQGELGGCLASVVGCGPAPFRPGPAPVQPRTSRETRAKLRLLLVEDNLINQEVALGMLESLGYSTDVAGDGVSALSALGRQDYDLVLMDCQLPEMDGYQTSRLIRDAETPVRNHDIPIVATTANAMPEDREKCLAAGMSDYLAKPLRLRSLEHTIENWTVGIPIAAEAVASPPCAIAPAAATTFDQEDFDERVMGNQQLARRILRGFVDDMPHQIALLAQAVREGDAPQARLVAHSIKGAAASVSGLEIRDASWKVEQQARDGDLTAAAAALPALTDSFQRARPVMERFCG